MGQIAKITVAHIAGLVLSAAVLCLGSGYVHARTDADKSKNVQDPHFGEVLFDFYQQKYFSALTHLLVAQQQARVSHHTDDAELLRAGMYLSYGMHAQAAQIFQRLIDHGASPQVRDRAWFFIAKIRHQRGYTAEAADALAQIKNTLPADLEEERKVLLAYLLMTQEKYPEAIEVLKGLRGLTGTAAYGRYNLGVALIRSGNTQAGIDLLGEVGYMPAADEEMRSLRDKANLALGYYFLQAGEPSQAKAYLNEIRIDGPLSNKALLGAGWGYSAEEKHQQSLVPWVELQGRDVMDTAVQEAMLAVPYAFGRLGAYKQALEQYHTAIEAYEQELIRLDTSIQAIRTGKMAANILRQDGSNEMGWFWQMRTLPDAPESHYLMLLMSSNEFQEAFKNYRDLRFLQSNLRAWSENIGVYTDMLSTRRNAYARRLPGVQQALQRTDLIPQQQARDVYAAEIARIEAEDDSAALATSEQKQLLARLARVKARIKTLTGKTDISDVPDKYRRLSGVLHWNLAMDYRPRLWQTKKELRQLDHELAIAKQRKESLQQVQITAVQAFEGYDSRTDGLRNRIATLRSRLSTVAAAQERYLEEMAVAELQQQKQRLAEYLVQARFAVAQIYDQAGRAPPSAP